MVDDDFGKKASDNACTQSNGFAGTKASDNACQATKETEHVKDYILLPLWTVDPPYSQDPKNSHDNGFKPSSDDGKKVDEDPRKDSECKDQEKEDNVNNTNNVNTVSSTVNVVGSNEVNVVGGKTSIELPFNPNMTALEDYSIFNFSRGDEDDDAEADMNNLDTTIQVNPNPTTRIHKDHPLYQEEPKKTLVDLPNGKRAIGSNRVFRNKKDDRGIMIRNKARLVAQGYTQEEEIDYDKVFAPVARIEVIRLFLAYASFKDFVVYQMDEKSAFLYGKIEEEVYLCQPPGFEDLEFPDRLYKVKKALYGLHQAPRAWFTEVKTASTPMETQKPLIKDEDGEEVDVHMYRSMIGSLMYLTSSRPGIMYLKGQPKLGLWYPKDSPFDLIAYTDSDYAGVSLDRKSTTGDLLTKSFDAKTINEEAQLHALVDGKKIIITESSVRRDLQLADEEGVDCLPNSTIFEQLALMGPKTTAWNEFSSTMASAIICLATNQKFNFSKLIFDSMIRNLDNASGKILMYPRSIGMWVGVYMRLGRSGGGMGLWGGGCCREEWIGLVGAGGRECEAWFESAKGVGGFSGCGVGGASGVGGGGRGSGYQQKTEKPSHNDKLAMEWKEDCANIKAKSQKMPKSESIQKIQQSNRSRN
ncbi:retrovirus-related pol polyprotein from transposon TNT 1-94 [Tanacetum coccineum]